MDEPAWADLLTIAASPVLATLPFRIAGEGPSADISSNGESSESLRMKIATLAWITLKDVDIPASCVI